MKRRLVFLSTLAILVMIWFATVIIKTSNTAPRAQANAVTTAEDTPVRIALAAGDREGAPLTYKVVTGPSHGLLAGTEPNVVYTPEPGFSGSDSFTFKVSDGKADSAATTVSIAVTPVNDSPIAGEDTASAEEDAPIITINVLANDRDPDNDRLSVVSASQGANGSVTINADGTLTYAPNRNFSGTDTFGYTLSDGKGGTAAGKVTVTISSVNDAPRITSKPVETARVWAPYTYNVVAKDPDPRDSLTYLLVKCPEGMTIDAATGAIQWTPTSAQAGTFDVEVKVADDYKIHASATQTFKVTVTSLSAPLTTTLSVADCFGSNGAEKVSAKDKVSAVAASDNSRLQTEPRSITCYTFSNPSIPKGAAIKSVVIFVEHFEDPQFTSGQLEWSVGAGWPAKPSVWASIRAPVRPGQDKEALDCWDVTSAVETPEKANRLQLQIRNDDQAGSRKTSADYIYAVVEWY